MVATTEEAALGRRTNYSFEKRQKEIKRAKKKERKLEEKRARKEAAAGGGGEGAGEGGEADVEVAGAEERVEG